MLRWFHFNFELKAVDKADLSNEAVDATEADEAEATEADKADEAKADVTDKPGEANVADRGRDKLLGIDCTQVPINWNCHGGKYLELQFLRIAT